MIDTSNWLAWGFPAVALALGALGLLYARHLTRRFDDKYDNR